jgi:hypothetical protein
MRHHDAFDALWEKYVPARGQADTKQGELLRAIEKLRNEALDNGNINWRDAHQYLVDELRDFLAADACFTDDERREINQDLDLIGDEEHPPDEGPYDRLLDRGIEWCRAHPNPIPHERVADLNL